jgi:hypothetical protein
MFVAVLSAFHDHVQLLPANAHIHVLADPSAVPSPVPSPGGAPVGGTGDTGSLQEWMKKNILTVLLLGMGLVFLLKANLGRHAEILKAAGISLIALMFIGLAAAGDPSSVGTWALGLVGIK